MTQEDFFKRYVYSPSKDKLGGGAFGKVYKAYDTALDKYVAIKIAEQLEADGRKFTLSDEFKALQDLEDHANIAKYEDLYTFESQNGIFDYAIMQYYPDGNLSQLIKNNILTEEQKERISIQLMDGVEFLHKHNVVHRDLKPSNILIHNRTLHGKTEYIPKITDFGLSKKAKASADAHFTNSFAAGTYAYSSPEQLKGEQLQLNTDWWAYGAIVYEIFTGKVLFKVDRTNTGSSAMDVKETLESILKNDISKNISLLPQKWQKPISSCLERNPEKRVKNAAEILSILNSSNEDKHDLDEDATIIITPTTSQTNEVPPPPPPVQPQPQSNEAVTRLVKNNNASKEPSTDEKQSKKSPVLYYALGALLLIAGAIFFLVKPKDTKNKKENSIEIIRGDGLFGYKKGDSIIISPKYTTAEDFVDGKAKVTINDSIYYIDTKGKMIEFIELVNKKQDTESSSDNSDQIAWDSAKIANTIVAFENYINKFPQGTFIDSAKTEIERITNEEKELNAQKEKELIAQKEKTEAEKKKKAEAQNKTYEPVMIFVAGGSYQMGTNNGASDEKPVHKITLRSFKIGKYPVTQSQWKAIMGNNPAKFPGCDNCPIENISWYEIQTFITELNKKTGKRYRLPTEAEWEYASRGGNKSRGYKYSGSNSLGDVGWYSSNSGGKTRPVGLKRPNELGIYDMSGNVWEWCRDWYGKYNITNSPENNPQGAPSGTYRIIRGGAWNTEELENCTSTVRNGSKPTDKGNDGGFRLVLDN